MSFSPLVDLLTGESPSDLKRGVFRRHDWLFRQGEQADAWWVSTGQVDCFDGAVLVDTCGPGSLMLPGEWEHAEHGARARDEVTAWRVPPSMVEALAASRDPTRHRLTEQELAAERRRRRRLSTAAGIAMTQQFPGWRGLYRPAPYTCDAARVRILPCLLGADAPLPPGVTRIGKLAWLVGVTYEHFAGPLDYGEMLLLVPVVAKGRVYLYLAWLFLDSPMAIFIGRELYGYPKMLGAPVLEPDRLMVRTHAGTIVDGRIRTLGRRRSQWSAEDRERVDEAVSRFGRPALDAPEEPSLAWAWGALTTVAASGAEDASQELAPGMLASIQQWLTVPVLGWQRTLQPHVRSPGEVFTRPWKAQDFVEDALVATSLLPARMRWGSLRFFLAEDELLPPGDGAVAPVHRVPLAPAWPRVGLTCTCRVTMELAGAKDSRVIDYRSGAASEGLDWGPKAWELEGWFG